MLAYGVKSNDLAESNQRLSKEATLETPRETKHVEVHVKSLVTGEKTTFAWTLDSTIQKTWDEAYKKLNEGHREGDSFRCADGTDLTPLLTVTLSELRARKLCQGDHFEIRGPSGGA